MGGRTPIGVSSWGKPGGKSQPGWESSMKQYERHGHECALLTRSKQGEGYSFPLLSGSTRMEAKGEVDVDESVKWVM